MNSNHDATLIHEQTRKNFYSKNQQMDLEKNEYDIFLCVGKSKSSDKYKFSDETTIEQVLATVFQAKRDIFSKENIQDYELYIAKKTGEPKDDYPGFIKSNG